MSTAQDAIDVEHHEVEVVRDIGAEISTDVRHRPSNEVAVRGATVTLFNTDNPASVIERASEVATALARVIDQKQLFTTIGQKKHVQVEGWTLLGSMLGVVAIPVGEPQWVEIDGIMGVKATMRAERLDGTVIGGSTSYCMRNEPKWKKSDFYAMAGMAQCVPLRAEILTRAGFLSFDKIAVGDDVLAYDPVADSCHWVELEAVNVFGPSAVVRMKSRSFDFTCTPDHTWAVTSGSKNDGRKLMKAHDLKQGRSIVVAAPCAEGEEVKPELAAVAGWLLTDGTVRQPSRGTTRMHIDQSKFTAAIGHTLDAAGLTYTVRETSPPPRRFPGGNVSVLKTSSRYSLTAESARKMMDMGLRSKDDGPSFAASLGPAAREAMLGVMLMADGSEREGRWRFGKINPAVMETFQILATLQGHALGRSTGFTMVNGNWMPTQVLRKNRFVNTDYLRVEAVDDEPVWCPTTPLGTWVMRLDGNVSITGNTRATSRSLRQPLGFIMQLAGYQATPAEEMVEEIKEPRDVRMRNRLRAASQEIDKFMGNEHHEVGTRIAEESVRFFGVEVDKLTETELETLGRALMKFHAAVKEQPDAFLPSAFELTNEGDDDLFGGS